MPLLDESAQHFHGHLDRIISWMMILAVIELVVLAAILILLLTWMNRRDDPRHAKRPLDPPGLTIKNPRARPHSRRHHGSTKSARRSNRRRRRRLIDLLPWLIARPVRNHVPALLQQAVMLSADIPCRC